MTTFYLLSNNCRQYLSTKPLVLLLLSLVTVFTPLVFTPVYAFHFPWDQGHDTTTPNGPSSPGPCPGGDCQNDPCNGGSQGSPVYIATGHFIWSETDIELKGRPTLAVKRTYNSHDPRVGLLGNGWSMSCDSSLLYTISFERNNNTTTIAREFVRKLSNGKRYTYTEQADGTFVAPGLFDVVTRQADNTGRLQRRDGSYSVYSELGRLLSDVDRNGNAINYTYDTQGRLTQKADTNGRSLNYEYNTNGLVSIIRDHTGREWQYNYDVDANLISVTDPLNGARQYAYEAYQATGDGHTYQHLTRVTDETGVVETEVTYSNERVATYKEYENTFTYQFDIANRRATKTDSLGSRWVFTYNETGQYTRIEKPLNRTEIFDRDEDSLVTRFVDASGTEYLYTYDQYSNRITQTDTRGTLTTTFDNDKPWPLTITTKSGRVTTVTYDANGNALTVTDPANAVTNMVWTAQGDLQQITKALGNQINITYSSQGMPLSSTDSLGRSMQYQYDSLNNNIRMINANGDTTQYQFDALDRVTAYTDGNGNTISYTYDAADRIMEVTASNGQSVEYSYDNFGRLSQRTFYDGSTYNYQYYSDNLINQITRPDNIVIGMSYDDAKRLTRRTIGNEDSYNYTYNLRDEVTNVSNNLGAVTMAYDDFGRKTSETVNGQTSTYQYNAEDDITQLEAIGIAQNNQFDIRGLLSQININNANYQYVYDALARMIELRRDSNLDTVAQYDTSNQILQIDNVSNLLNYQYEYDLAGRINRWQGIAGETRSYSYDNASRLTSVQSPSDPETFSYDSMGNRQNDNAQFDVANRITENDNFIYGYDVNGNRVQKNNKITGEVERYTYNSLDQLVRYQAYPNSDPTAQPTTDYSYTFGPLGRRWSKQNNLSSDVVQFYWSGSSLIGEDSNGVIRRYILEALTPVGFIEGGQTYHYLRDHLGTAHRIIDSTGNIVWQGNYSSFGVLKNETGTISNYLRLAGQYADSESKLYYNYYRDYDPVLGRYLQTDPLGLFDGPNTYTYVYNNPLTFSDPTGEFGIIGAGIGAGIDLLSQLASNGGNWSCVSWGQVAVSAGLGAVGGGLANGLVKGAFRFKTVGSNSWSATKHWGRSRNIKAMQVRNGQHRHHWLLQRNQGWGSNVSNRIKNQPWNLNPVSAPFNGWMARGNTNFRSLLGAPPWARGVAGGSALAGGGAAANALGGGNNCDCQ